MSKITSIRPEFDKEENQTFLEERSIAIFASNFVAGFIKKNKKGMGLKELGKYSAMFRDALKEYSDEAAEKIKNEL